MSGRWSEARPLEFIARALYALALSRLRQARARTLVSARGAVLLDRARLRRRRRSTVAPRTSELRSRAVGQLSERTRNLVTGRPGSGGRPLCTASRLTAAGADGRGHFDPWMAAVVLWVRGDPVPLLRTAEATRFLSMPFDLAIRHSPSRMVGGGGSELIWSWLLTKTILFPSSTHLLRGARDTALLHDMRNRSHRNHRLSEDRSMPISIRSMAAASCERLDRFV